MNTYLPVRNVNIVVKTSQMERSLKVMLHLNMSTIAFVVKSHSDPKFNWKIMLTLHTHSIVNIAVISLHQGLSNVSIAHMKFVLSVSRGCQVWTNRKPGRNVPGIGPEHKMWV